MTAIELSELAGAIAAQIPRIPLEVDLWSAKEVAPADMPAVVDAMRMLEDLGIMVI